MVGRRNRVHDVGGGGLVSQRIGQFEKSKQSQRKQRDNDGNLQSHHNRRIHGSNSMKSNETGDDIPILQWSGDSDSPQGSRSGYSETDSWRQFHDDRERERDESFYSALYGAGSSSSIGTEATDARVDTFLQHLQQLEAQDNNNNQSLEMNTLAERRRNRQRIRQPSKTQSDFDSQGQEGLSTKCSEEEELDKLVLESSSSGSNGASEWFKTLLEEAASKDDCSKGSRKNKGERHVRWKKENQEHHFSKDEREGRDVIRKPRTPRSKNFQSWKQASNEFGTLFHDNDPDSILQSVPRHPSRVPSSQRNLPQTKDHPPDDWDFGHQIFPSALSPMGEGHSHPSESESHFPPLSRQTRQAASFPDEFVSSSPPESPSHHNILSRGATTERKINDPPAANSSTPSQTRMKATFSNHGKQTPESSILLRRVNLEPSSSSSSRLDPDGVVLNSNGPQNESDQISIQNQADYQEESEQSPTNIRITPRIHHHYTDSRNHRQSMPTDADSDQSPVDDDVSPRRHKHLMASQDNTNKNTRRHHMGMEPNAIHNQVIPRRKMHHINNDENQLYNNHSIPRRRTPHMDSTRWLGGEEDEKPDWTKSPRSTWIPVNPPANVKKQELMNDTDPNPEELKTMRLKALKRSLEEKNYHYNKHRPTRDNHDDDDDSSLFSDLMSPTDKHAQFAASPTLGQGKLADHSSRTKKNLVEREQRKTPPARSRISSNDPRHHSTHKVKFAEESARQKDLSLLDAASSSESENEASPPKYSRVDRKQNDIIGSYQQEQNKRTPYNVTTNSAPPFHEHQSFTPITNNRTRDGTSTFSEGSLSKASQNGSNPRSTPASQNNVVQLMKSSNLSLHPKDHSTAGSATANESLNSEIMKGRSAASVGSDLDPLNSGARKGEKLQNHHHHPPFTSVRDTVASPHSTSAPDDFKTAASISVGDEKDGHRPFTSVRGTVASTTQLFHEDSKELISPASVSGRRQRRQDQPSKPVDSDQDNRREKSLYATYDGIQTKDNKTTAKVAGVETRQSKTNGHTRDYWKSIRALKTLGSFDSLSVINDPARRALQQENQEFVDRDNNFRAEPFIQQQEEPPATATDGQFSYQETLSSGNERIQDNRGANANNQNEIQWQHEQQTPMHSNLNSPLKLKSSRTNIRSFLQRNENRWNREGSMPIYQQEEQQEQLEQGEVASYDNDQYFTTTIHGGGRSKSTLSPSPRSNRRGAAARSFDLLSAGGGADRREDHRSRSQSSQSFNSPVLFSRESEDSGSTTLDDQTASILDGGTTVAPAAACCTFTIGDLSWGLDWFRFKRDR